MSGFRVILSLTLSLCGLLGSGSFAIVQADDAQRDASAAPAAKTFDDSLAPKEEQAGDEGAQVVPLNAEALKELSQAIETGDESDPAVPDFFISELQVDGEAGDQWVNLTAHVTVRVVENDRWLNVPLRFDQALLIKYAHDGAGDASPSTAAETDEGLSWLLRGKGIHKLTLTLRVPLRKTSNGRQLQLRLPELSELFAGELTLRLPGDNLAVQAGDEMQLTSAPQVDGSTTSVRAMLSGDRIDLRWHPVVEETAPISRTMTNMTLRLRNDVIQLAARQEIRLRQENLPSVEVKLPPGDFQRTSPVRISEASGTERQVQPVASDREGWVRVPLKGVVGTFARFDWSFETPFNKSTEQIVVEGLEIAGASEQSGSISVEGFDRHLLTRRPDSGEGVTRIGVDELPAAGAFANLAYRFQAGTYRLVLDVDPIESTFRVTPTYLLELTESQAKLESRFLISVDQGQVDALSLVWPDFSEQSWSVASRGTNGGEVRRDEVTGNPEANPDADVPAEGEANEGDEPPIKAARWLLKPSAALRDGTQAGLSASRALTPADGAASFTLTLPRAADAHMLPGLLVVVMADNVEATMTPQSGTRLSAQAASRPVAAIPLAQLGDQSRKIFEIDRDDATGELTVQVDLQLQPREVRTRSVVNVEALDTGPQVTQTIHYEVEFGRLSSLKLQLPEWMLEGTPELFRSELLRFQLDGKDIPAESHGNVAELKLSTPRRGSFDLTIGPYRVALPETGHDVREIPIITSVDRAFTFVRVEIPELDTLAIDVPSESWTPIPTLVTGAAWITNEAVESVTLQLDTSLQHVPQRVAIATAFLQSQVDETGAVLTTAQYRLGADVPRLVLRVPSDADRPRFTWGGKVLSAELVRDMPEIAGRFVVERPADVEGASWLSVTYRMRRQPLGWAQATTILFPSFGAGVTIERTYWQVNFPRGQHLLARPELLSPQYEWTRRGLLWSRSIVPAFEQMQREMIDSGAEDVAVGSIGNDYAFETLGTLQVARIDSMNNSMLIFVGAGLTLVACFLVLKVPAARNLWLWLLIGAAGAIVSLWHLEAMLLLIQPAAYGMILPICAAIFEKLTERKSALPETISSRSSFEMSIPTDEGSSVTAASDYGRNVPSTLVRPTAVSDSGVR